MTIKLITDGGADFSKSITEKFSFDIVPLNVLIAETSYKSGTELKTDQFYRLMKNSKTLPKTSSPSPNDFYEMYRKHSVDDEIIVISLSSSLSSTYESATIGKNMLLEEEPNRKIEIIDSKTASVGQALLVYRAAQQIENGISFSEIVENITEKANSVTTQFVLDTLENVIKGGRLDRVKGAVASVLNIKLLMEATDDGRVDMLEKVRGSKKALKRLIENVGVYSEGFENKALSIAHSNCEDKAKEVLEKIKALYPFSEITVTELGPVIGTYAGEGGIVLAYE
jgi:DegV family protein with EDD domain